jgi:DNA-binding LytR/AlgR family response regulator
MQEEIFLNIRRKLFTRINSGDILLIASEGNYSKFITTRGSYLVNTSITQIDAQLPPERFCRVHPTYIVPIARIKEIDGDLITLDDKQIPLAKKYRNNLFCRIKIFR